MATTTYRYVGTEPEVFPAFSSAFIVAGRQDDPNAEDFQQPGELRPGQEFEGPAGVVHVRLERKNRAGSWVPTAKGVKPSVEDDQGDDDQSFSGDTEPAEGDAAADAAEQEA